MQPTKRAPLSGCCGPILQVRPQDLHPGHGNNQTWQVRLTSITTLRCSAWSTNNKLGVNEQRAVTYLKRMPPPEGMKNRPDEYTPWLFRRNYTWSIVDNGDQASSWGDSPETRSFKDPKYNKPKNVGPSGFPRVLCALNTFGQDDLYRIPYNGYCLRGPKFTDGNGWQDVWHAAKCILDLSTGATPASSQSSTKRDATGDWEVLSKCFTLLRFTALFSP